MTIHKDLDGESCSEELEYRSIVGILLYIAGSARPDISYAVTSVRASPTTRKEAMR